MAGLTPLERAIVGEPEDRRERWNERMKASGHKRVNVWVPEEAVELLKEVKTYLQDSGDREGLRDFLTASYRDMLEDPECDDLDRQFARDALARLGALPAGSEASEDSAPRALRR